jgi:hypothetical protein
MDTGARTSALHAFFVEPFEEAGIQRVRFGIHPLQGRTDVEVICEADAADRRLVSDSGGHREVRWVIRSRVALSGALWPIEITLADRETMRFRMLLGRTAMKGRLAIDPARSYACGREIARAFKASLRRRTH